MACLDTTLLLDVAGKGGGRLRLRAREELARLVAADEVLTTTRFNVAGLWVGVERAADRWVKSRQSSGCCGRCSCWSSMTRAPESSGNSPHTCSGAALPVGTWMYSSHP